MHPNHFVLQSIVPVRSTPSDTAEMVTQLLFGDLVEVLEVQQQWRKVRNHLDGYEGWIDEKMIGAISGDWLAGISHWEMVASPYVPVLGARGNVGFPLKLVQGSRIPIHPAGLSGSAIGIQAGEYQFRIPRMSVQPLAEATPEEFLRTSDVYIGAPYLWGGKSPWGIDCSGFTQIVLASSGIYIPRDASQQVLEGKEISFGEHQAGDLAFFENDRGTVHHVGLLVSEGEIRHAHGQVHDDLFTEAGIVHKINQERTHRLCSIRRFA